jgi:hypothetical protein
MLPAFHQRLDNAIEWWAMKTRLKIKYGGAADDISHATDYRMNTKDQIFHHDPGANTQCNTLVANVAHGHATKQDTITGQSQQMQQQVEAMMEMHQHMAMAAQYP